MAKVGGEGLKCRMLTKLHQSLSPLPLPLPLPRPATL
jgi:hypothetical protein